MSSHRHVIADSPIHPYVVEHFRSYADKNFHLNAKFSNLPPHLRPSDDIQNSAGNDHRSRTLTNRPRNLRSDSG